MKYLVFAYTCRWLSKLLVSIPPFMQSGKRADNCLARNKRSLSHNHGWKEKEKLGSEGRSKKMTPCRSSSAEENLLCCKRALAAKYSTQQSAHNGHWTTLRHAGQLEQTFRKSILDYSSCSALVVATPYAALPKGGRQSYRIIRHHGSDVYVLRNYLVQNGCSYTYNAFVHVVKTS